MSICTNRLIWPMILTNLRTRRTIRKSSTLWLDCTKRTEKKTEIEKTMSQTTLCDWFKILAPPIQPIRCKTKTNCDLVTRVFPRFASVTCTCFKLSLVRCVVCLPLLWLVILFALVLVLVLRVHSINNRCIMLERAAFVLRLLNSNWFKKNCSKPS